MTLICENAAIGGTPNSAPFSMMAAVASGVLVGTNPLADNTCAICMMRFQSDSDGNPTSGAANCAVVASVLIVIAVLPV
jgi:hypothetical protein